MSQRPANAPRDLAAADFDRARTAMLEEWRTLVAAEPSTLALAMEIAATTSAMNQIACLGGE